MPAEGSYSEETFIILDSYFILVILDPNLISLISLCKISLFTNLSYFSRKKSSEWLIEKSAVNLTLSELWLKKREKMQFLIRLFYVSGINRKGCSREKRAAEKKGWNINLEKCCRPWVLPRRWGEKERDFSLLFSDKAGFLALTTCILGLNFSTSCDSNFRSGLWLNTAVARLLSKV